MIVKKPTIVIYTREPDAALLREICAGIEEEGVLFEISPRAFGDAAALAREAAEASMLGSGIGLCGASMALHIKGMNLSAGTENKAALLSYDRPDAALARDLGSNSARVIKKLPLRLPEEDGEAR